MVSATPVDPDDRRKDWYCQGCGGLLDKRLEGDPSGQLACSDCATSHWATTPPSEKLLAERRAELEHNARARALADERRAKAKRVSTEPA
jgi:hypothetical protein